MKNKNKLQQKICAIFQRTINAILHIFSTLYVSLKTDNRQERDRLKRIKRIGKIRKDIIEISGYKRYLEYKGTYADLLRNEYLMIRYSFRFKNNYKETKSDCEMYGYDFDEYIEEFLSEEGKKRLMIEDRYF